MRFNEKNFEIRFCAALTAALMPFNRNPQWFGLTQKQERMAGFDAMLRQGGHLTLFQFKALRSDNRLHINLKQLKALMYFSGENRGKSYYIFPSFSSTKNSYVDCILVKSFIVDAYFIYLNLQTLLRKKSVICKTVFRKHRCDIFHHSGSRFFAESACKFYGCHCPSAAQGSQCIAYDNNGIALRYFSPKGEHQFRDDIFRGIYIEQGNRHMLRYFEEIFAGQRRWSGRLVGLFLPAGGWRG
jgi:hypothetical protein